MRLCFASMKRRRLRLRTAPSPPCRRASATPEGYTYDCLRHGTTTLFAALDAATGEVIARSSQRHRHQEWLAFLRLIDKQTPEDLAIQLACDNYATHKHAKVRAWIARRPRFHLHFAPTYASWLNQVERWFAPLSQRAIKRPTCPSVMQLKQQIMAFTAKHNESSKPFVWVATADSIFEKLGR